jgi:ADP-ribose pyrophosphatase YjhB (NUDIX family)
VREYPAAPLVGVGAVVVDGDRVLLVRRGRPPALGRWSLPGGLVEVGEPVEAAVRREVAEECGLAVLVHGLVGVVDRIVRDPDGRVRYHYVLLDYLATPAAAGRVEAGSDALAAQWCDREALGRLDVTEGVESMVRRAFALEAERRREERG